MQQRYERVDMKEESGELYSHLAIFLGNSMPGYKPGVSQVGLLFVVKHPI